MEKQMFLDFGLRFNLRQTKVNKPTIIYAVFMWKGTQYKINTSVKVYPSHWDNKTQSATVSNRLPKLINHNNSIVNKRISEIITLFSETKYYLCQNLELDVIQVLKHKLLFKNLKNMKKFESKKITSYLEEMIDLKTTKADSKYRSNINGLKKFLEDNNIDNNINLLNGDLLNDYQKWLAKQEKTISCIRQYIQDLKTLINRGKKYKKQIIDLSTLDMFEDKRTTEQKKSKQVPLTEKQLIDIYNLQELTEREVEARDLFICQSLLGQRISDMPKIFNGDYTTNNHEDGLETISFNVQKTGEQATLFLFPIAKEIIQKYRDKKFNHFNLFETDEKKVTNIERMINKDLKEVCKKAGLTSEINYTVQIGEKIETKRKPLYHLMHTHIARHTFITIMCKMGVQKDVVIIATAHTDIKMIDEVYLHETASDKGEKLIKSLQNNNHQSTLFNIGKPKYSVNLLNNLFAYDSFISIIDLMNSNNDVFHLDSTKQAMETIKDISKLCSYSKDADITKVADLENVIFELSYYFSDSLLYSIFKHKEHYFGMDVDVPSTEEVEAMFVLEDIERPKKQIQADIDAWENR